MEKPILKFKYDLQGHWTVSLGEDESVLEMDGGDSGSLYGYLMTIELYS